MSRLAAEFIETELEANPDLILCASAGGTPTGTYQRLAATWQRNRRMFRKLRVLQIDEWAGLPPNNPATCRTYLEAYLLRPLAIGRDRFTGYRSDSPNPERECERVQQWLIKNGPIDICLLGLGLNGHIAMIEPNRAIMPHVHLSKLTPRSLKHGMLQALTVKPRHGLTLGMADILASRKVLLVVSGLPKRAVLKRLLADRKVSTRLPASFLWLHPDLTIICDQAAMG